MKVGVNNLTENILTKEKFFLARYPKRNAHKLIFCQKNTKSKLYVKYLYYLKGQHIFQIRWAFNAVCKTATESEGLFTISH